VHYEGDCASDGQLRLEADVVLVVGENVVVAARSSPVSKQCRIRSCGRIVPESFETRNRWNYGGPKQMKKGIKCLEERMCLSVE
jgi:hypothetical protein